MVNAPRRWFAKNNAANSKSTTLQAKHRAIQEWHCVGGKEIFFRSQWEWRYAIYLQWCKEKGLIKFWTHEPKTFWFEAIKRGVRSYLPDFWVQNDKDETYYVEVKGYYDSKSLTKIKRFRKYYPQEKLVLVDSKWFRENGKKLSILIPDYRSTHKKDKLDGHPTT
jgi:hypothetical protein